MRKIMLGIALAASISAAGCNTTITAAQVEAATQTACGFLPTATSVTNLIAANPALTTAEAVAAAICSAVTSTMDAAGATPSGTVTSTIVVNGKSVTITGTFVHGDRRP